MPESIKKIRHFKKCDHFSFDKKMIERLDKLMELQGKSNEITSVEYYSELMEINNDIDQISSNAEQNDVLPPGCNDLFIKLFGPPP